MQLNYDKLQYKKQEVDFSVKHTLQVVTSQIKTKSAITKMPAPANKMQVQSFIGMINYLSKLSARMSEIVEPIQELAKDKVPFNWDPQHQSAFTQMKQEIVSAIRLAYYNPKKQTVLQTDASIKGLGSCLLQEEKPVYFANKALTEAQWGYVAIELESLAVAWLMEMSHHFLHASHFIFESDQKQINI